MSATTRRLPALANDERTMLEEYLDFQRATLLAKVDGLTQEELGRRTAASELTLAGLLKHAALAEDHWFRFVLLGEERAPEWREVDWDVDPNWEFRTALDDTPDELVALYGRSCAASRAAAATIPSLDHRSARTSPTGEPYTLRWIHLHMLEEAARHNGHADLLREAVDGTTGV